MKWSSKQALVLATYLGSMISPLKTGSVKAQAMRASCDSTDVCVQDKWRNLHPSIRYLERHTSTPLEVHALIVDLTHPDIEMFTTAYEDRWHTVSEFAESNRVLAATNGGFWNFMQRAKGMTAGKGMRWPDGRDDTELGFFALRKNHTAWISLPERNDDALGSEMIHDAVSGEPLLVRDGKIAEADLKAFDHARYRHPRTAVGTDATGQTVFLIVADGRQGHSKGMTLYELAAMFLTLGAHTAINLDGGGSSAIFIANEGIANSPSGGRWQAKLGLGRTLRGRSRLGDGGVHEVYVRGFEREVMNHIGIRLRQHALRPSADVRHLRRRISRPKNEWPWHLGRTREFLVPAFYGIFMLSVIAAAWRVHRSIRRRH